MLGCYVGAPQFAAKGVPEQFLTGLKPEKKEKDTETTGQEESISENAKAKDGATSTATNAEPMEVDKT
jgi:vacuolar protein sorting-associated protein 72